MIPPCGRWTCAVGHLDPTILQQPRVHGLLNVVADCRRLQRRTLADDGYLVRPTPEGGVAQNLFGMLKVRVEAPQHRRWHDGLQVFPGEAQHESRWLAHRGDLGQRMVIDPVPVVGPALRVAGDRELGGESLQTPLDGPHVHRELRIQAAQLVHDLACALRARMRRDRLQHGQVSKGGVGCLTHRPHCLGAISVCRSLQRPGSRRVEGLGSDGRASRPSRRAA